MNNRNSYELDLAAFSIYKKVRRDNLKTNLPTLNKADIEPRIFNEWENMTEKEKLPYVKLVEDNPRVFENICQASSAHHKHD